MTRNHKSQDVMNGDSDDKMDEIELENTGAIRVIITGPDGYDNPSFNNDKNDESGKGDNSSRRGSRFSAIDVHGTILSDLGSSEEKEKRVNFDDERDEALHLITTSSAPPKDFNLEVRASLDIKHYLKDMTISLDLQSDDLYNLVHHLVNQVKKWIALCQLASEQYQLGSSKICHDKAFNVSTFARDFAFTENIFWVKFLMNHR